VLPIARFLLFLHRPKKTKNSSCIMAGANKEIKVAAGLILFLFLSSVFFFDLSIPEISY
jgi:hypothetical protein